MTTRDDDATTADLEGLARPWEQLPGESPAAYYCFTVYRDLPPLERSASRVRSDLVSDASRTRGRSKRQIETYRSRFLWVARVKAWDAHQDEVRRRAQIQEHIVMGQRQATEAQAISAAMMIPVRELLRRMTDVMQVEQIQRLGIGDLLMLSVQTGRVWPQTMRAERLARGAPTPDYGAFAEDPEEVGAAGSVLDDERHLGEVWLAMEEAGLAPRARLAIEPPAEEEGLDA